MLRPGIAPRLPHQRRCILEVPRVAILEALVTILGEVLPLDDTARDPQLPLGLLGPRVVQGAVAGLVMDLRAVAGDLTLCHTWND